MFFSSKFWEKKRKNVTNVRLPNEQGALPRRRATILSIRQPQGTLADLGLGLRETGPEEGSFVFYLRETMIELQRLLISQIRTLSLLTGEWRFRGTEGRCQRSCSPPGGVTKSKKHKILFSKNIFQKKSGELGGTELVTLPSLDGEVDCRASAFLPCTVKTRLGWEMPGSNPIFAPLPGGIRWAHCVSLLCLRGGSWFTSLWDWSPRDLYRGRRMASGRLPLWAHPVISIRRPHPSAPVCLRMRVLVYVSGRRGPTGSFSAPCRRSCFTPSTVADVSIFVFEGQNWVIFGL